jgi:hypothetical protein
MNIKPPTCLTAGVQKHQMNRKYNTISPLFSLLVFWCLAVGMPMAADGFGGFFIFLIF